MTVKLHFAILLACAACSNKPSRSAKRSSEKPDGGKPTEKVEQAPAVKKNLSSQTPRPKAENLAPLPADKSAHVFSVQKSLSGGGIWTDSFREVAMYPDGGALICGYATENITFGNLKLHGEKTDVFFGKIDAAGNPVWAKNFGGHGDDHAESCTLDAAQNAIVVGSFANEIKIDTAELKSAGADDIFVAKYSPTGERLWIKRMGGTDIDAAYGVTVDKGLIYVTGEFGRTLELGNDKLQSKGAADALLLQLSPEGEIITSKTIGTLGKEFGRSVVFGPDGTAHWLVEYSGDFDFGETHLASLGNRDAAVLVFSPDMQPRFAISMGSEFDDLALGLAVDGQGSMIVTGSFDEVGRFGTEEWKSKGRSDLFVAKFDKNGGPLWSRALGNKENDLGTAVVTDEAGNIYVSGIFWYDIVDPKNSAKKLVSRGNPDALFWALNPEGTTLWMEQLGGTGGDQVVGLTYGKGKLMAVGSFQLDMEAGKNKLSVVSDAGKPSIMSDGFWVSFSP